MRDEVIEKQVILKEFHNNLTILQDGDLLLKWIDFWDFKIKLLQLFKKP